MPESSSDSGFTKIVHTRDDRLSQSRWFVSGSGVEVDPSATLRSLVLALRACSRAPRSLSSTCGQV